jgi:putative transcription antitermination factor YqgF
MRILGIDYGSSNIGLALGIAHTVQPLKIIQNIPNHKVEDDAIKEIVKIVDMEGIDMIVIGMPYRDGKEAGHSKAIRTFATHLRSEIYDSVKIQFVDESSTSKESLDIAIDAGLSQKSRKADHAIAAGLIIKRWWEENPNL